jgi:hypothetical protein
MIRRYLYLTSILALYVCSLWFLWTADYPGRDSVLFGVIWSGTPHGLSWHILLFLIDFFWMARVSFISWSNYRSVVDVRHTTTINKR